MMMMDEDKYEKKALAEYKESTKGLIALLGCMMVFGLMHMLFGANNNDHGKILLKRPQQQDPPNHPYVGWRVLYVVTTLNEYDTGSRNTVRGLDRFQETLIPVVRESIERMISVGFQVDLFVICHFEMTRANLLQEALPAGVGLEIWDDATPFGYKLEDKKNNYTQAITRALARQHRFVIKDKFQQYDMFVNFEDDMLITGDNVLNYLEVTQELYRLRDLAPEEAPADFANADLYYGVLTKRQLQRMMPGFIRVEALLDENRFGAQQKLDPVPVSDRPQLDPKHCCHLQNPLTVSKNRPAAPTSDQLILWETNIKALGVRKMPRSAKLFDWVLMQRGPKVTDKSLVTADYWSGSNGYFEHLPTQKERNRPHPKTFKYINNQGGWMATRHQIWEWHSEVCPGGFLPPFDPGDYNMDGLDGRNVEYWSGGMNLVTREHACNLQRIIPMDPDRFAKSLLYHTANNKQRQLHGKKEVFVKINDLLGELNTVRSNAQADMDRRLNAISQAVNNAEKHEIVPGGNAR